MKKQIIRASALICALVLAVIACSGCEIFSLVEIGYINTEGELVIPGTWQEAQTFHEGLAGVMVGSSDYNGWGFIDTEGEWAILPEYSSVRPFYEGLAPVAVTDDDDITTWKYINHDNEDVFGKTFNDASVFVNGVAPVQEITVPQKWGLINTEGEYVLEPCYDLISVFDPESGLAMVRNGGETAGRCGYINYDGEEVISTQYYYASAFNDGYATVKLSSSETAADWGVINTDGELVLGGDWAYCGYFEDGLCPVYFGESVEDYSGRWGYVDTEGNIVLEAVYVSAGSFSEGLAAVQLSGKEKDWAYIDTEGNIVFSAPYSSCGQFSEGLAPVVVVNGMLDSVS